MLCIGCRGSISRNAAERQDNRNSVANVDFGAHLAFFINDINEMLDPDWNRLIVDIGGVLWMSEFLPKEVRDGLEKARLQSLRKKSRLRVRVGGHDFTILRYWDEGFALNAQDAPNLRGLVDLYDGARHISQCLIVASAEDAGEMVYEFKRETMAYDQPALDYERDANAPIALIAQQ